MKIVGITETDTKRSFEVCLEEECSKDEEHIARHETFTWGLDGNTMSQEDMIREIKLLLKPKVTPKTKKVSIAI